MNDNIKQKHDGFIAKFPKHPRSEIAMQLGISDNQLGAPRAKWKKEGNGCKEYERLRKLTDELSKQLEEAYDNQEKLVNQLTRSAADTGVAQSELCKARHTIEIVMRDCDILHDSCASVCRNLSKSFTARLKLLLKPSVFIDTTYFRFK